MLFPWFLSRSTVTVNKRLRYQKRSSFCALMKTTSIAIKCIDQNQQNNNLGPNKQAGKSSDKWSLKTNPRLFVVKASIKKSWKCLSRSVAFHFVFILARQTPTIASSLLFLPDQAERGCGLNMSSQQQATSNLPPFASMLPINTLLPPRREATDSEGDRRGPGVMEIWSAWKRERGRRMRGRETEIEAENEREQAAPCWAS